MTEILCGDPLAIGLDCYTREEGEAILRGEPVGGVETPTVELDLSCVHRGRLLEIGKCDQCGEKGNPFDIFYCGLHGRCSIRRKHRKVKSCAACPDRQAIPNSR